MAEFLSDDEGSDLDIRDGFAWRSCKLDVGFVQTGANLPKKLGVVLAKRTITSSVSSTWPALLEMLPIEVQHTILNALDLSTLLRMSRVSSHWLTLVQSLPAYQELLEHAPSALAALARTNSLFLFPASYLRAVLRSDRCECCGLYGAYLFLPNCTRCCWDCSTYNPSLRAITRKEAARSFGLKKKHSRKLPRYYTVPGRYIYSSTGYQISPSLRLVSAVTAREMGISVHGTVQRMEDHVYKRLTSADSIFRARFLLRASSPPPRHDQIENPWRGAVPTDDFYGMAVIPFPSVTGPGLGVVEHGVWCKGCRHTLQLLKEGKLLSHVAESIYPSQWDDDPYIVLLRRRRKAMNGRELTDHVPHCYGAKKLIEQMTKQDEQ